MGQPRPRRKPDRIAGAKAVQHPVQPDIRRTRDDMNELLLMAFGMGQRGSLPRCQPHVVDANGFQTKMVAQGRGLTHRLIRATKIAGVLLLDLGPVNDGRMTGHSAASAAASISAAFFSTRDTM
jgi:hypothetical protein